jgi:carboxyl-terminal processing protease
MIYRSTKLRRFGTVILFTLLAATASLAQVPSETVALKDRIWMASKIYSSVRTYFGHWQAVPDLDLDAQYKKFVDRITASDDRRDFDFAAYEFVASLKNGHSDFYDRWLFQTDGKPTGFTAARNAEGKWLVNGSDIANLAVGDELNAIDGIPFDQFFREREKYLSGSNEAARQRALFYRPYFFPQTFELTVNGGKKVRIDRQAQIVKQSPPLATEGRMFDGNIAYLKIPSFGEAVFEEKALEFVKANASAKAFVIDVRGNGGGSTPGKLIAALMDRPYRDWLESTSANIGVYGAYRQLENIVPKDSQTEGLKTLIDNSAQLEQVQIYLANKLIQPSNPIYKGRVIVLTNFDCASACEDFVMPLKISGRAEIYGTATRGSTGQPYMYEFSNGMGFRISAKRAYLPDGSQFEGVGITPTVLIEPTAADVKSGKDPVLERAISAVK